MYQDWCFSFDYMEFLRRWGQATTGTTWAYGYSKSEPSGSLIATFVDAVRVLSTDLSAAAAAADVLNTAESRRDSVGLHLSATILRARSACSTPSCERHTVSTLGPAETSDRIDGDSAALHLREAEHTTGENVIVKILKYIERSSARLEGALTAMRSLSANSAGKTPRSPRPCC